MADGCWGQDSLKACMEKVTGIKAADGKPGGRSAAHSGQTRPGYEDASDVAFLQSISHWTKCHFLILLYYTTTTTTTSTTTTTTTTATYHYLGLSSRKRECEAPHCDFGWTCLEACQRRIRTGCTSASIVEIGALLH